MNTNGWYTAKRNNRRLWLIPAMIWAGVLVSGCSKDKSTEPEPPGQEPHRPPPPPELDERMDVRVREVEHELDTLLRERPGDIREAVRAADVHEPQKSISCPPAGRAPPGAAPRQSYPSGPMSRPFGVFWR